MPDSEIVQFSAVNKGAARYALLLDCLANQYPEMVSLAEIARRTDLPKATAFRLMKALQEVGFVAYDSTYEAYLFGGRMMELGAKALGQNFAVLVRPSLQRIANDTGDTAFGVLAQNDHMQCLLRFTGSYPVRTLSLDEGDIWPLGIGAVGMALLAANDDAYVDGYIERCQPLVNRYAPISAAELKDRVRRTREQGYAVSDGDLLDGMSALGMAIHFPGTVRPIGAISVAAISSRLIGDRKAEVVEQLRREVDLINQTARAQQFSYGKKLNDAD
ncbi:IclR family transcriptional regulator [Alcaligenaceae bacterium]|nr:IclR family transcriptional regulator [Alcaligenaceae bacterium]